MGGTSQHSHYTSNIEGFCFSVLKENWQIYLSNSPPQQSFLGYKQHRRAWSVIEFPFSSQKDSAENVRHAFSPKEIQLCFNQTGIAEDLQRHWKHFGGGGGDKENKRIQNTVSSTLRIIWLEKSRWWAIPKCKSEPPCLLFHRGTSVSLVLGACPHFQGQGIFFSCHQQWAAPSLLLFLPVCSYPTLRSVLLSRHWVCLSSLPPYVHTLLNNLRSENAIIECLSIQLDHRDMLFLPISFAPFRWLNNVCVSSTSTLLDVGGCRWESSVCQVCH